VNNYKTTRQILALLQQERTSVTFSAMNVSFTFFYYKNKAFWFSLKSMM